MSCARIPWRRTLTPIPPRSPIGEVNVLLSIELSSSDTTVATVPQSVNFPFKPGQYNRPFSINTIPVADDKLVTVTANFQGQSEQVRFLVRAADLVSFTLDETSVVDGNDVTGTVSLDGPTPAGGANVMLSSSNPTVVPIPSSIVISTGSAAKQFAFNTKVVPQDAHITITASYHGDNAQATLNVLSIKLVSFTISAPWVTGGDTVTGTVNLNGPSPITPILIELQSSDTSAAYSYPGTVMIPSGSVSKEFQIYTVTMPVTRFVSLETDCSLGCEGFRLQLLEVRN